jgi:hypothetical protein
VDLREHLLADNGIVGLEIVEPGDVERADDLDTSPTLTPPRG